MTEHPDLPAVAYVEALERLCRRYVAFFSAASHLGPDSTLARRALDDLTTARGAVADAAPAYRTWQHARHVEQTAALHPYDQGVPVDV